MAAFAGLRGTGDWATDERPKNFREFILWEQPNGSAPLTALLAKMASESVNDPEYNWWEERLGIVRVQTNVTTTYASGDNTIVLSTDGGGLNLVAGDLLMIEKTEDSGYTNEIVMVSSVTNDTTIVIRRGAAGSTAASLPNNSFLTRIGSAFEEGSSGPGKSNRNPTKLFNYCQIFKTSAEITATADKTKTRTGDPWANDKKRKAHDHSVSMEFAFMFGKKHEETGPNGKPRRYTGGLRSYLATNVKIFTTTPTEDTFLDAVYKVFDYNTKSTAGDQRIVFAGNGFLNSLNKLARSSSSSRINFDKVVSLYGMNLQRWIIPQGSFAIKTHPLLNVHGRHTYSAFIIDPSNLKYRYLRDTKFMDNTQGNDEDTHEGIWLTEAGLEVRHEATMAYLSNFVV